VRFEKAWGEVFTDDEAAEFIRREKPKVVAYVHAETSTGALQSGRCDSGAAAHDAGALAIADCVTSLGGVPIEFDRTGIDVAYSCTQKGFELSSRPVSDSDVAQGDGFPDCPHHSLAQLVSRPQTDSRLFHGVATAITTQRRFPCSTPYAKRLW